MTRLLIVGEAYTATMTLVVPNSTYEDPAAPGTAPGISAVDHASSLVMAV